VSIGFVLSLMTFELLKHMFWDITGFLMFLR